ATAVLRSFQPIRWLVCSLGAFLTLVLCAAVLAIFKETDSEVSWLDNPLGALSQLGRQLFGHGTFVVLFRGFVFGHPFSALWSVLAGWLARCELLAQQRRLRPELAAPRADTAKASAFVLRRLTSFVTPFVM